MNRSKKPQSQDPKARERDNQTKFIKDSVSKVENSFATLCGQMGAVNRRNSRLRDKFDEMAKFLVGHANTEPGPLKVTLTQFAEHMSAIQDYRQALIDRMDGKVIQPLTAYKTSIKHTQRAVIDVERGTKSLEETIDKFETQRVADIKKILSEFVQIEMLFHAKSLERLTLCHQDLQNLNLDDCLLLFRNSLRPSQVQQRLEMALQQQTGSHQDVPAGDVYATPHAGQVATPSSLLQTTTVADPGSQGQQHYDQEEYDDEYSEEEDGDEEESEYETEEEDVGESPRQQRLKPW